MQDFRIFTESKADIKFLKDYIEEIFQIQLSDNYFDPLGSWSGYKAGGVLKASISQNYFDDEKSTVIILDADDNLTNRREEVLNDFAGFGVPISLFLFPNNYSIGSLETLLCDIAVERQIINCFAGYETCIAGYHPPVVKSKVYAYLDALLPANQKKGDSKDIIQEGHRNYRNPGHWNLHHHGIEPLRNFLQTLFLP
jgi:hypothetical protein